ncbi:MAG: DivIVA domain-containing protein [Bacilli bacterium]|jgi:DivIVA domain-containing protein
MKEKKNLTSEDILLKKFGACQSGYNPEEVDRFLDQVLLEFQRLEKMLAEYIPLLVEEIKELRTTAKKYDELLLRYQNLEKKVHRLDKNPYTAEAKLDLLMRIDALEKALYKLGKDPAKIK